EAEAIVAHSPVGSQDSLEYVSVEINGIQGYGDIAWIGNPDSMLRSPSLSFWKIHGSHSFAEGETSVETRRGQLLLIQSAVQECLRAWDTPVREDVFRSDVNTLQMYYDLFADGGASEVSRDALAEPNE